MKKTVKIVAIVGMAGAGKTQSADFFSKKNIPVLRFGDQTDIGLKEFNLPQNQENERWYREKLRKELGMSAYAVKILPRIEKEITKGAKLIVLDGLYSWEEYIVLLKKFPDLILLCIYASPKIRYRRLSKRPIRSLTTGQSKKRDWQELEKLNKGGPIAIADYLIKNEKSKANLASQLDLFLKKSL